LGHIEYQGL